LVFGLIGCLTLGCSHLGSIGVGPAIARPTGIEKSYGDELRLRYGAGSSDDEAITLLEVEGRAALTERTSAISIGLGPAYLHWLGPVGLTGRITPALGAQYFAQTPFASAGVHGGLGVGFVLESSERELRSFGPWPAATQGPTWMMVVRERTLLTLELTGAADAHVHGATLSAGLLLGIAWSDEQLSKKREESAPWFLR
jgi:hypothetical protein